MGVFLIIFILTACNFEHFFFFNNSPSNASVVNWIMEVLMRVYDCE